MNTITADLMNGREVAQMLSDLKVKREGIRYFIVHPGGGEVEINFSEVLQIAQLAHLKDVQARDAVL